MTARSKILGVATVAALAIGASFVVNAGAEGGGHFVVGAEHTIIKGTQEGEDYLESGVPGLNGSVCDEAEAEATVSEEEVEAIALYTGTGQCHTTESESIYEVNEEGCHLTLTVGKKAEGDNTAVGLCTGHPLEILHPSCRIETPEQTRPGLSYSNIEEEGKHAITLTATVEGITVHFEEGFCIFLGTTHETSITGSVILRGYDTEGEQVDITAVGSEE